MFKQILAVTTMGLRGLPSRVGTSLVIVVGITGVVAVLVSVLAMAAGFQKTLSKSGRDDRVIVLRGGSNAELSSSLSREDALTILDAPGLRHNAEGKPIGSAEAVVVVSLPSKSDGGANNVTLRGVGPLAFETRPEIRITEGRMFQPAVREMIVGSSAARQFAGLSVGSQIDFRDSAWTVVGHFESDGDSHESEMLADTETVLSAYRRNGFQSVTALLDSADAFELFKDALTTNPQLKVDVLRESDYYRNQSRQLATVLNFLAYAVGGIMAVGAMFGALNTMYSAVSARSVEIATLRALGFGSGAVVVSVIIEALLLALLGGVCGAALAWMFFNGNAVNTLGSNFTQVVFRLDVSGALVVTGIVWACLIGLIGGLFPAVRAARLPVVEALRAV